MKNTIIFSGTTEGRNLSEMLSKAGISHLVSVVSDYGESVMHESDHVTILKGRLDETEMEELFLKMLEEDENSLVVDATHPYATEVTENIKTASKKAGVSYIRVVREEGNDNENGGSISAYDDIAGCAKAINDLQGNILLTTGSKELSDYCNNVSAEVKDRTYVRVLPSAESLKICEDNDIPPAHIIAMHGPFSKGLNKELFLQYDIRHLVTKESGSRGGFEEKLSAASELNINVHVIKRPVKEEGMSVEEAFEAIAGKAGRYTVILSGIGPGDRKSMTKEVADAIEAADAVFGAHRLIAGINKKTYAMYRASDIIPVIKKEGMQNAVVLFSGDTGFYSGARSFKEAVKSEDDLDIKILPGIASFSYLASKIGESYEGAVLFSLHGKTGKDNISDEHVLYELTEKIRYNKKVFALLSGYEDIRKLGDALLISDINCELYVGINLSYEDEKIIKLSPGEASHFSGSGSMCLFVLNKDAKRRPLTPVIGDDEFIREKVPMTKECIRHESIRRLNLHEGYVVYDIGGGTGSVAIEIAKTDPSLKVYTIEQKSEAVSLINKNREKLKAYNLTVLEGEATSVIKDLEDPDAVFIGGSSGRLKEMIEDLISRNKRINVVINAIMDKTKETVFEIANEYEINDLKCAEIAVTDIEDPAGSRERNEKNPITIFSFSVG